MRDLAREFKAHPKIRDLAKRITVRCRGRDWVCEARSLQAWVQQNIKYQRDVRGMETVQTPDKTLADGSGDCDDQSVLLAAMLESIGHPVRFLAVGFRPGGAFEHVYVETRIGAYWQPVETILPWPLGQRPRGIVRSLVEHI